MIIFVLDDWKNNSFLEEVAMSQAHGTKTRLMAGKQRDVNDIKDILEEMLKPIKDSIASLPDKSYIDLAVENINKHMSEELEQRDEKIRMLEERVDILESRFAVLNSLDKRIEESEQYSRRYCLRLYGITMPSQGESENVMKKVEDVLTKLDCGVGIEAVDRAHRIGQVKTDQNGTQQQQVIILFNSFSQRTKVYRKRKTVKDVKIRLDLTRTRLGILKDADDMTKLRKEIDFVFADINCRLTAKLANGKFIFFESIEDLKRKLDPIEQAAES